jgi:hypothetical protein
MQTATPSLVTDYVKEFMSADRSTMQNVKKDIYKSSYEPGLKNLIDKQLEYNEKDYAKYSLHILNT